MNPGDLQAGAISFRVSSYWPRFAKKGLLIAGLPCLCLEECLAFSDEKVVRFNINYVPRKIDFRQPGSYGIFHPDGARMRLCKRRPELICDS